MTTKTKQPEHPYNEFLENEFLEIDVIVTDALEHTPGAPEGQNRFAILSRRLRGTIEAGQLRIIALRGEYENGLVNGMTSLSLQDFWKFLNENDRKNERLWKWAPPFCERWAKHRDAQLDDLLVAPFLGVTLAEHTQTISAEALAELETENNGLTEELTVAQEEIKQLEGENRRLQNSPLNKKLKFAQRVLVGLAISDYGYKPGAARNPAAASFAETLWLNAGLEVDKDTISKHLSEGKEDLPAGLKKPTD